MVKILANGDIVPDNDPRVTQNRAQQRNNTQGGFHSAGVNQDNHIPQQVSLFQILNQRLLGFGIPRWNMGNIVIEPIVLVGFLIALLLFGFPGLIFGALLFAVCSWSQNGAPDFISNFFGSNENPGRDNRNRGRAGGGYRLGR
ncbi:protein FAM241B-like [Biomphalaria glabrata]|uniref:Protein FAM241B-like n=1 Tax=Biomphalaria glabrata TaxID=6526 RepID=A0A2C9JQ88_BIOGL|nr:protein FAM241B-like [Biomphalaria glabrata]KAI8742019.1 protein FAM241B [Biomphalaria glabrata]